MNRMVESSLEQSNRNVGLDWMDWIGISLNSLTTRSPYGDKKRESHRWEISKEKKREKVTDEKFQKKRKEKKITNESKSCLSGGSFRTGSCGETGESGKQEANHKQRSSGFGRNFFPVLKLRVFLLKTICMEETCPKGQGEERGQSMEGSQRGHPRHWTGKHWGLKSKK